MEIDLLGELAQPTLWALVLVSTVAVLLLTLVLRLSPVALAAFAAPVVFLATPGDLDSMFLRMGMVAGILIAINISSGFLHAYVPGALKSDDVTALDGLPLRGGNPPGRALASALVASIAGTGLGVVLGAVIMVVYWTSYRAPIAGEILGVALFGLLLISVLNRSAMLMGTAAGLTGLMMASVGFSDVSGQLFLTLGFDQLWDGLPLLTTVLALVAIPDAVMSLVRPSEVVEVERLGATKLRREAKAIRAQWPTVLRHAAFVATGSAHIYLTFASSAAATLFLFRYTGVGARLSPSADWINAVSVAAFVGIFFVSGAVLTAVFGVGLGRYAHLLGRVPSRFSGALVISLVLVVGYAQLEGAFAAGYVAFVAAIGLVLKLGGWPRLPLVAGLAVGGTLPRWGSISLEVYGGSGTGFAPLNIAMAVLAIAAIVAFVSYTRKERMSAVVDAEIDAGADALTQPAQVVAIGVLSIISVAFVAETMTETISGATPIKFMAFFGIAALGVLTIQGALVVRTGALGLGVILSPRWSGATQRDLLGVVAMFVGTWLLALALAPAWVLLGVCAGATWWFTRLERPLVWTPVAAAAFALFAFVVLKLPLALVGD